MKRILFLEDNTSDADLVSREIKNRWPGVELIVVSRIYEAKKLIIDSNKFDVAIFDLNLPDGNGMDLLTELREENNNVPIIILTGAGSEELATTALKAGANNYVPKKAGFHLRLPEQIKFTLEHTLKNQKHISVLYVEHQKSDIDLTIRYFKKFAPHIHFKIVSSGDEIINISAENSKSLLKYDVIILDYRLPGLNALELSKYIREELKLSIAIIIVTGQGDEDIAVEALKIGVDDYIVKRENYLIRMPSIISNAYNSKELERQKLSLQESEMKYRLLADYAADWEYWINPEGEYVYISSVCQETTGYSPEEFRKNKDLLTQITKPEYKKLVAEHFSQQGIKLHKPFEFIITTADGKEKWISHFCQAVYDNDNNYAGKRGVNRDITERKQAEEILLKMNKAINNSGEIIFMTDIEGIFTFVNEQFTQLYGFTAKEVVGMSTPRILKSSELKKENVEQLWNTLLNKQSIPAMQYVNKRKDGKLIEIEGSADPIIDDNNEIIGFLGIQRDITERKRIEKELSNSEEKFRKAFMTSPDSININRLEDGMFITINKGFTQILGYTEDEVIGKTSLELNIWGNLTDRKKIIIELKVKGYVENIEARFLSKKNVLVDGLMSAVIIDLEGTPHILSITRDITNRKIAERDLLNALEKAKESDRLKTAFLANMSHEIRTPMNGIVGFVQLLKNTDYDSKKQLSHINIIEQSSQRLLNLIDDLMNISKIEAGQTEVYISKVNISNMIDQLYAFFEPEVIKKGLKFSYKKALVENVSIFETDNVKLYGILSNLIKNAIKYTDEGSIEFGCASGELEEVMFYVKDTGIGIPKERQEAIFDRFIQADIEDKQARQGAGLGLSIAKAYVNILGGKIWVDSEPGKGSQFNFSISAKSVTI